jgi:uncharacterized protein (DUF111 family)
MPKTSDLMGLGIPAAPANLLGDEIATLAGVGTAQSGAGAIGSGFTKLTTASGQTAVVLPSNAPLLRSYSVFNSSATTALVFPPSGAAINGASADASYSLAQNKMAQFFRVGALEWRCVISA